jgi:hypothetical protein
MTLQNNTLQRFMDTLLHLDLQHCKITSIEKSKFVILCYGRNLYSTFSKWLNYMVLDEYIFLKNFIFHEFRYFFSDFLSERMYL